MKEPQNIRLNCSIRVGLKSKKSPHRGFTFVELMVGIIVTSIVLCALAVFTFGVSQSWTQGDSAQSVFLAETMAVERIGHVVHAAQMIEPNPTPGSLDNSTPAAACMLWTDTLSSTGTPVPDGKIQYCEMSMLAYDVSTDTIMQYSIPTTASNAFTYSATLLSEAAFVRLPNVVEVTVANNVSAAQFFALNAASATALPSLELVLEVTGGNSSIPPQLVYNTFTLRAANSSPQ